MILGFFGTIYITWIYNSWLPGYLEMERHMSVLKTGMTAAIPAACGVVGGLFGGWLVDFLVRRGLSPINSRKYPMSISLLGMAVFTVLAAEVDSNVLAVTCISVAMFLGYVSSSTAWAMASVAAPANCTASLGSMQNFGGYLGWCAGADGDGVHRAGDGLVRAGAAGGGGDRRVFVDRVFRDHPVSRSPRPISARIRSEPGLSPIRVVGRTSGAAGPEFVCPAEDQLYAVIARPLGRSNPVGSARFVVHPLDCRCRKGGSQ